MINDTISITTLVNFEGMNIRFIYEPYEDHLFCNCYPYYDDMATALESGKVKDVPAFWEWSRLVAKKIEFYQDKEWQC